MEENRKNEKEDNLTNLNKLKGDIEMSKLNKLQKTMASVIDLSYFKSGTLSRVATNRGVSQNLNQIHEGEEIKENLNQDEEQNVEQSVEESKQQIRDEESFNFPDGRSSDVNFGNQGWLRNSYSPHKSAQD